jgi:hypothetical protein
MNPFATATRHFMPSKLRYRIGWKLSSFYTVEVGRIGVGALWVGVGLVEKVTQSVIYTPKERVVGDIVDMVRKELQERGDFRMRDDIMVFQLPPNDRNVKYVAYHTDFIKVFIS